MKPVLIHETRITPVTPGAHDLYIVDPATSKTWPYVLALDTKEKWLDIFVEDGDTGRILIVRDPHSRLAQKRLRVDFDIVNKHTGEVLVEVRQ